MIRGVLCDLSGVLYVGDRLLPGAQDAIVSLRAAGIPVKFLTNTTRSPRRTILAKLARMGLDVPAHDLYTPSLSARDYVLRHRLVPYLLVHPDLVEELADLSGPEPNSVLMGDAGHAFTYESLNSAFRKLLAGVPFLALGDNRYFQELDGLSLDIGPFVRALEYAAGSEAMILGKPSARFFHAAVESLGFAPDQVIMVGDDYEADVEGALAAGLQAILVRTGKYRPGDESRVRRSGSRVYSNIGAAIDAIL